MQLARLNGEAIPLAGIEEAVEVQLEPLRQERERVPNLSAAANPDAQTDNFIAASKLEKLAADVRATLMHAWRDWDHRQGVVRAPGGLAG